jgi:hypothetical protein
MDIDAESSAQVFSSDGLVRMVLRVSNPASSSYLRFSNLTTEILRLAIVMERGLPRTADPSARPPSAIGNHDIAPSGWYDVAFHVPDGSDAASNVWSTRFGLGPSAGGTGVSTLNLRVILINGPSNDNWATVQIETL